MSNYGHTMTQIQCACRICKINAEKIGATLPLRAEVTESLAAILDRKGIHNVVADAHHPGLRGGNPLIRAL